MTTAILAGCVTVAAVALLTVLWSLVRSVLVGAPDARLRRRGLQATGTVVGNSLVQADSRRVGFSPVVEFHSHGGLHVSAPAQQTSAASWPLGSTVDIAYDAEDPQRFVLADEARDTPLLGNLVVAILVLAVLIGTVVTMYLLWWHFGVDARSSTAAGA
jgi:Protein of unknown function (DUF3592)